jgi:hypothetical protein
MFYDSSESQLLHDVFLALPRWMDVFLGALLDTFRKPLGGFALYMCTCFLLCLYWNGSSNFGVQGKSLE